MRRLPRRALWIAGLVIGAWWLSGGAPTAEPACGSCPADACPGGAFESVLDQICALSDAGSCSPRCGCCRDELAEPFAGVTFGAPVSAALWPGLGGKGKIAGQTELCLLRDLGNFPGGIPVETGDVSLGPLGAVKLKQRVGYTSFDPVAQTMQGFHAVSLCVPPFGCVDDQTQSFTATLLPPSAQQGLFCGPYPLAEAYALRVASTDTEHRLDLALKAIEVLTPYGTVSGTPAFHYETALKSGFPEDITIDREHKTCVDFHSELFPLSGRDPGAQAVDFLCDLLPRTHFLPGYGGIGQIALGGRSADPSIPIYAPGTPRPDLRLETARTLDEKQPVGSVGASVDFVYDMAGLVPEKFRKSPFSLVAEVFVKPAVDTHFASQFQIHGSDAAYQLATALPADCKDDEFHRARVDLRSRVESLVSFRIDSGFNLVLKLKHDFGGFIGTISVKVIDKHPKFDVIPPIHEPREKDGPVAGALFGTDPAPSFQSLASFSAPGGVADPQAFLNECFATTPPAQQTPPTPTFTPDDPRKFTKVLEFPCNICMAWDATNKVCGPKDASKGEDYECNFEGGQCTDPSGGNFCVLHDAPPELQPAGSSVLFHAAQGAGQEWLCDAPEKTGCMDLCTYDPTAAQPLKVVRSAVDLDPDHCTGSATGSKQCSSAAQCDDANPCTLDTCSGGGEFPTCHHSPQEGACDDGLFCDGADHCALGSCSVHDGNPCAAQAGCCSEGVDACVDLDHCPHADPRCGNGLLQPGEGCDDGNATGGDGCSAACLLECGNHVIDPGETCDDGNTQDDDGCSAICRLERVPPDCSHAFAATSELWPPNHKFVQVTVSGVTDSSGNPAAITITGVSQDEPPNGLGDGDTCPDAEGTGTSSARLRAERAGTAKVPGDGRVYHVAFTADDGQGGQCSGLVTVCVPHDQRPGHACVDQGMLYDSGGPCPAP